MNAKWISNMCAYRHHEFRIASAKKIIDIKIRQQSYLLRKYHRPYFIQKSTSIPSIQELLLYEARAAKYFWKEYAILLPVWCAFPGRNRLEHDPVNILLNIGYHALTNIVATMLEKHDIAPALGIIHEVHHSKDKPLAYDLVEMFRADIVDTEVLRFVRLKKKPMVTIKQSDIAHLIYSMQQRIQQTHYLRIFKQCHRYKYYMELQLLKFIYAVNHRTAFEPILLPSRHDTRCSEDVEKSHVS